MKTIAVATTNRADFGILTPLLRRLHADSTFELQLIVSGSHFLETHGNSIEEVWQSGIPIAAEIPIYLDGDSEQAIIDTTANVLADFGTILSRLQPDLFVATGDRYEMFAAASAALLHSIPIAHIHGGEETLGAVDNCLRHAITKMGHLHFAACQAYAERLIRMGECPDRVFAVGALALDDLANEEVANKDELESFIGVSLDPAPLVVTFHPVTLELHDSERQVQALLDALRPINRPIIITAPNVDAGNAGVYQLLQAFEDECAQAHLVKHLGRRRYFGLLRIAAAMVGNSSSGILEAPSFSLPVVNIGNRQAGRVRAKNIQDIEPEATAISHALAKALSPGYRASLAGMRNPFDLGGAGKRIVEALKKAPDREALLHKPFYMGQ